MFNSWLNRRSPQRIAFFSFLLGIFGTVGNLGTLVVGDLSLPAVALAVGVVSGLLMSIAGIGLWKMRSWGWWFGLASMVVTGAAGALVPLEVHAGPSLPELSSTFNAAFMLLAAGFFFQDLSHPTVYEPCFVPTARPRPILLAMPLLMMVAGSVLLLRDEPGRVVAAMIAGYLAISGNWRWLSAPLTGSKGAPN